jgi:hypothetical protein
MNKPYRTIKVTKHSQSGAVIAQTEVATLDQARAFLDSLNPDGSPKPRKPQQATPSQQQQGNAAAKQAQRTPGLIAAHRVHDLELAETHGVALGHPASEIQGALQFFTDDGRGNGLPIELTDARIGEIVTACNAHDELVARCSELEFVLRELQRAYAADGGVVRQQNAWQAARAALAKAQS